MVKNQVEKLRKGVSLAYPRLIFRD